MKLMQPYIFSVKKTLSICFLNWSDLPELSSYALLIYMIMNLLSSICVLFDNFFQKAILSYFLILCMYSFDVIASSPSSVSYLLEVEFLFFKFSDLVLLLSSVSLIILLYNIPPPQFWSSYLSVSS